MQVNIALLTVTDTRTIDTDKSGAILVKKIQEQNHKLIDRKIVKDEKDEIKIEVSKAKGKKCDRCWKILEHQCTRCSNLAGSKL